MVYLFIGALNVNQFSGIKKVMIIKLQVYLDD